MDNKDDPACVEIRAAIAMVTNKLPLHHWDFVECEISVSSRIFGFQWLQSLSAMECMEIELMA